MHPTTDPAPAVLDAAPAAEPAPAADREDLLSEVITALLDHNTAAERYAEARHRIGALEERVRTLEAENGALRQALDEALAEADAASAPRRWLPWGR